MCMFLRSLLVCACVQVGVWCLSVGVRGCVSVFSSLSAAPCPSREGDGPHALKALTGSGIATGQPCMLCVLDTRPAFLVVVVVHLEHH